MSEPVNVVALAEGLTTDMFHQILDLAIDGRGRLPGARASARHHLEHHADPEAAVRALINQHTTMASGQGFATNWGGILVSMVTIPANLAAATFLQARVVAGIAHLRGYELTDPRVRTAILMVMLGPTAGQQLIDRGLLPSSAAAVATAPVFDEKLDTVVTRTLLDMTMNQLGGKRLGVMLGKRIPLIGGGVGAVVDGWSTHRIAHYALRQLPSRRPKLRGWSVVTDGSSEDAAAQDSSEDTSAEDTSA